MDSENLLTIKNLRTHFSVGESVVKAVDGVSFNLEAGKYQTKNTSCYCISSSKLMLFNSVLGTKFDTVDKNKINSSERRVLLDLILTYFKLHLHGFKIPKSLSVLNKVFN